MADAAGNQARSSTLTEGDGVRVDLEGPVLSEISIISDNDNVSWGREGDNITLSFTSNETIQTPDLDKYQYRRPYRLGLHQPE